MSGYLLGMDLLPMSCLHPSDMGANMPSDIVPDMVLDMACFGGRGSRLSSANGSNPSVSEMGLDRPNLRHGRL